MKVTLKYEECENTALHVTLRLTLPPKFKEMPNSKVVKTFVDHYNKKNPDNQLDMDTLHLKVVGGDHLDPEEIVQDVLSDKDECYLMGLEALQRSKMSKAERAAERASSAAAAKDSYGTSAATKSSPSAPKVLKNAEGHLRCKRFGCQRYYDPNGPPQECTYHKSAPVFHEVAKWWSCCQDKKAYDFDEFMAIPGCCKGFCSATPEGQENGKRVMGGCDLRGDSAPVRMDPDAPPDPRRKLAALCKGLVAIGVEPDLFEKVWAQLAAGSSNDIDKVVEKFRRRMDAVLEEASA
jgi:hypothetical protein